VTQPGTGWHRRLFRGLLLLYPRWFRDEYGEEMTLLFLRRMAHARRVGKRIRLWWRIVEDAVAAAAAVRRRDGDRDKGRGGARMETLLQDLHYVARALLRSPVFTAGAVALLAVGIGANTTAFTVVDTLLFRPPPWSHPERVVHVYQDSDDGEPSSCSYPAFQDIAGSRVFSAVTATSPSSASWERADGAIHVSTEYTTSSYLKVLGLSVQRGRWFGPENDLVGGAPVAVVSAATWHARMGSDPDVVGRTIRLNGQPVTIIGVGPEGLTSTVQPFVTDLWLSISATPVTGDYQVANLQRREDHWYQVLARLEPGVSLPQARAAMNALADRLAKEYPQYNRGRGITVFPSKDVRVHPGDDGRLYMAGGLLSAVVLTLLLLACANLANLLLVRGLGRSDEMAVRSALGASRGRVARLFLLESMLLTVVGGLVGLLLTRWTLAVLPTLPIVQVLGGTPELHMDRRVAVFSLVLMAVTGVLFGLAPAVRSWRTDVALALREDRRAASGGRGVTRLRSLLVAVQVAASLVLVLGTGLLARSLAALQNAHTGVDTDRVAYLQLDWSKAGLEGDQIRSALDDLQRRIAAIPGVAGAAFASRIPAQSGGTTTTEVEGYTPPAGTSAVEMPFVLVSDGYFRVMGVPLLDGRLFNEDDVPSSDGVSIIINETAARRFWGDVDVIGRRMRGQGSKKWTRTVVGVVGDAPISRLGERPRPMFYFATRQVAALPSFLVARTDGPPSAILAPMRRALAVLQPSVAVDAQSTLAAHFGASLSTPRTLAKVMGVFSLLALLLAGLGIYAVVSFSVARRTSELGIRMALGAEGSRVVRMVVGEVAGVVILGLAVGLAVSALTAPRMGGMLYGVRALDPVTFGGAVLVLSGVAWLAAWIPARRAARADPVEALRTS
jgi:putative ABC transport system permease protein